MYSISFILALLAFGGLAAYLGDVLGYRLGKRRLSLLRLRPRTTARLVGIVAGIMIPAVTMVIGAVFFPWVRTALLEFDSITEELTTLRSERVTLEADVTEARTEAERSKADLGETETLLDDAEMKLVIAEDDVERLRDERGNLRGDLQTTKASLTSLRDALTTARNAVDKAKANLAVVEKKRRTAIAERNDALTEVDTLKIQADSLRTSIAALDAQIAALERALEQKADRFAGTPPIVDLGTELVRGVIRKRGEAEDLTDEILALYVLADQAAEAAGAAEGPNGRFVRAIGPPPIRRPGDDSDEVPESRIIANIVRTLWNQSGDEQVVQVTAARRAYAGDQVDVWFSFRPNEQLFSAGDVIVEKIIEPDRYLIDVLEKDIWPLIAHPQRSEVRKKAMDAGMLPNPETGGYGALSIREMYRAAQQCAESTEPLRIRVLANEDAYTVGPLSIWIAVEPLED